MSGCASKARATRKINLVAYAAAPDTGSESAIAYDLSAHLGPRCRLFTTAFSASKYNLSFSRRNGMLVAKSSAGFLIVIVGSLSEEPTSNRAHRSQYALWLLSVWILFVRRTIRGRIWIVNLAQLICPALFIVSHRQRLVLGPLGGQGRLHDIKWLPTKLRVKNAMLRTFLYPIFSTLISRVTRAAVVHPAVLGARGALDPKINILPAITMPKCSVAKFDARRVFSKRTSIVVVGSHDVPIKLPEQTKQVTIELAKKFPKFQFKVIGPGWQLEQAGIGNVEFKGAVERHLIFQEFCNARLHIFLSMELAGTVALESATGGCPTFCLEGFGADYLLGPTSAFKAAVHRRDKQATVDSVIKKVSGILCQDEVLEVEAAHQINNASQWTVSNKCDIFLDG